MTTILLALALVTQTLCADYVPNRQETSVATLFNIPMSIADIIATALPASLVSAIVTNPVSVGDALSSQFAAGHTPAWFSNLPASLKSQIIPPGLPAATVTGGPEASLTQTPVVTRASESMHTGMLSSIDFSSLTHVVLTLPGPHPATTFNTTATHTSTSTVTKTTSSHAMTSDGYSPPPPASSESFSSSFSDQATPTSTGGAVARPTALLGAGVAGLMGAIGYAAL